MVPQILSRRHLCPRPVPETTAHGATPLTAEDRFSGAENVHLSEEGRTQVIHLAERLADDRIEAVYCSPLDRTLETANLIAKPHGLTPILRDGLREISHEH